MLISRQTAEHAAPGAQTEPEKKSSYEDKDIVKISRPKRRNNFVLTFGNISASCKRSTAAH